MIQYSWNRHARDRRNGSREYGVVVVVGDGETEKRYFDRLSDLCTSVGIKAYASAKTGPDILLRKTSEYAWRHGVDPSRGALVAIVMDLDGRFDMREIEEMDRRCRILGYQLFLSNPSFEVWLCCHFGIPTHPCTQSEAVDDLRKRMGGSYSKPVGFDIDDGMVDRAIVNARRLLPDDECTPVGCYRRNPSTMVHSLVEAIRNRASRRRRASVRLCARVRKETFSQIWQFRRVCRESVLTGIIMGNSFSSGARDQCHGRFEI